MKKISGVLFDFDGVLSSLDVRLGWPFYQALKKIKPNITKQEILLSLNDVMKMYLNGEKRDFFYVPKMIFKIAKTLHLGYLQMFRFIIILAILVKKNNNNIFPEEHADDVLKQITTKYRTALITHAEREVIQEAHKKFVNLKDLDLIITQQDIDYAKPHPQGIKKAIQQLGLKPSETVYVGDLPHDIQAGKNAGIMTIAVINFKSAEKGKKMILEKCKPDFIINHVSDLPALIHKIESTA